MIDYQTHDIVLAATLKVKGCTLEEITIIGKQGFFHFTDVDELLLSEFDYDRILVEPKAFNTAVRNLTVAVKRIVNG